MKRFNFFVLIVILIVLLSACSDMPDSDSEPKEEGTDRDSLVLAIGGEPEEGFDPTTGWGLYGSPLFQSTLLTFDKDFNVEHDLATNYETSEDGLEYTVEIRDDVKFSDGSSLTAKDVVFTYETAKDSGSTVDLSNLEEVVEEDSHQIKFSLKEPESTFIYSLSNIGIVPEELYGDDYNENPIGSGPFKLVQWDKGQQLIVKENEHYYGEKTAFKQLTFLFLSEDTAFASAKSGEVDVAVVPPSFAKEDVPGMRLEKFESVDNRGIVFPYESAGRETEDGIPIGNDVTADKAIRQAINIGIDREALVDGALEGFGTPAYTVADKLPWWNEETVIEDADMDRAKELLEEAGWKEGENGIREKDGLEASFTLLYPSGDQLRQSLSLAFADMMKELGIDVDTEDKSWNDLERFMYSNPVMMGWGSHTPLEMYNIYSSDTKGIGFYNMNYYSNKAVDEYMEKALRSTDLDEADEYWKKAQWDGETGFAAQGDAPWAWLVNLEHLYFINEDLEIGEQKIQPHGHGWPILDIIEDWHWRE